MSSNIAALHAKSLPEACLPLTEMEDDAYPRPLLEAPALICATISSLVHTTPMLLKLLHFQVSVFYSVHLYPFDLERLEFRNKACAL